MTLPRSILLALALLHTSVAGCVQGTPQTALDAIRLACEMAGAPDGDLDVCADLIRAEAEREAARAR